MGDFFGFITLGIAFGAGFFYPMAIGMLIKKAYQQH
jgi:hypothetical protein